MNTNPDLSVTGNVVWDLVLLGVCLLLSGFFSSSETALTALSEHRVRQLLETKPKLRRYMNLWLERPNRVLTTVLIGNNVVNTFTAALATIIAQQLFSRSALSLAVGLTTIALLVFGEITPKTFAKHNAERLAPFSMRILLPTYYAMYPAVVGFTWLSKALVRISGGEVTRTGPFVTEEDIAFMISLGAKEGVIDHDERDLITNVFDFADTLVKTVMIPRTDIDAVTIDDDVHQIFAAIKEHGHTRMPVYGESADDVRGFFHTKDLFDAFPDLEQFDLNAHIRPPVFVPELERIGELLKTFQRTKTHLAVVVDEYGGTAGIVCLEDIIEEIVGEIRDEHDEDEAKEVKKLGDDRYIAEGKAHVHEISELIDVEFPDDARYETVAGFVISSIGKMPKRGQRVLHDGWAFTVLDVDARRVAKVGIERTAELSNPGLPTDGPDEPSGPNHLRVVRES